MDVTLSLVTIVVVLTSVSVVLLRIPKLKCSISDSSISTGFRLLSAQ